MEPHLPAEGGQEPPDLQTVEEIRAHFEGPVAAVYAWVETLTAGDWRAVWRLSDDTFRLVRAQAWLWNNRNYPGIAGEDLDQLAAGLAIEDPEGELWTDFARLELAQFRSAWADWDLTNRAAASRPRPVGLDYEVVLLVRAGAEPILITKPTPVEALRFLTHLVDDRWLVANAGSDERLGTGMASDHSVTQGGLAGRTGIVGTPPRPPARGSPNRIIVLRQSMAEDSRGVAERRSRCRTDGRACAGPSSVRRP